MKNKMDKRTEFYKKLKKKLKKDTVFPSKYLYKFIIQADKDKINQIEEIFDHTGAVINKTASKTGKYMSVSVLVTMKNADAIIAIYREAEKVEGIISL
jgi:putative lipoic acid-binding regulatory protein